jgi:hypothetical protein
MLKIQMLEQIIGGENSDDDECGKSQVAQSIDGCSGGTCASESNSVMEEVHFADFYVRGRSSSKR